MTIKHLFDVSYVVNKIVTMHLTLQKYIFMKNFVYE